MPGGMREAPRARSPGMARRYPIRFPLAETKRAKGAFLQIAAERRLTPSFRFDLLADLRIDRRNGGHVQDPARGRAGGQDVHWLVHAHQDRADRHAVGEHPHQVVSDVGRFQVRQHEQVGAALQGRARQQLLAQRFIPCGVALHFAIHVQARVALEQQLAHLAHLQRILRIMAAKVGVRQQRHLRLDAEQLHAIGRLQGRLAQLLGGRIFLHVGIDEEEHALLVDHAGHRRGRGDLRLQRQHAAHVAQLLVEVRRCRSASHRPRHGPPSPLRSGSGANASGSSPRPRSRHDYRSGRGSTASIR